jgi:glucokinase
VLLANDSDSAGLAEARFGAGKGNRIVLYNNVGSGIGGALVIDGQLYTGSSGIASEIGHLRPGLQAERADQTVESLASGWAIASAAQALVSDPVTHRLEQITSRGRPRGPESVRQRLIEQEEVLERCAGDLLERCQGQVEGLTTVMVAEAALQGNELARDIFAQACQALGWALGQVVTLLAPNVIVLGGGVSLVEESLFLDPLRKEVDRYVFPPLRGSIQIVRAGLGEEVVVHGVLALAHG